MHSAATLSQFHWNISTMTDLLVLAGARAPKCRAFGDRWASVVGQRAAAVATRMESFDQGDIIVGSKCS